MVRALLEAQIRPDLVLGTSIGALNGAFIAADPTLAGAERLADLWREVAREGIFLRHSMRQAARIARQRTHLLSHAPLQLILDRYLPVREFSELKVPFQCVAARIEDCAGVWFEDPLTPPARPWEVAQVAFEISRRHRYVHELESVPSSVALHVLPSGASAPTVSLVQASRARMRDRMERAYAASAAYLADRP